MSIENAEQETDLFYAEGLTVHKRGLVVARETDNEPTKGGVEGFWVCECSDFQPGLAEEIARALNRLPKAEAILVDVAAQLRNCGRPTIAQLAALAQGIEDWIVG